MTAFACFCHLHITRESCRARKWWSRTWPCVFIVQGGIGLQIVFSSWKNIVIFDDNSWIIQKTTSTHLLSSALLQWSSSAYFLESNWHSKACRICLWKKTCWSELITEKADWPLWKRVHQLYWMGMNSVRAIYVCLLIYRWAFKLVFKPHYLHYLKWKEATQVRDQNQFYCVFSFSVRNAAFSLPLQGVHGPSPVTVSQHQRLCRSFCSGFPIVGPAAHTYSLESTFPSKSLN